MDKDLHTVVDELFDKIERLQAEKEHYRKEAYRLADGLNKTENLAFTYKQALQEIRDIAGSIIGNANATYTDFYNKLSDILDKINSVIGAE